MNTFARRLLAPGLLTVVVAMGALAVPPASAEPAAPVVSNAATYLDADGGPVRGVARTEKRAPEVRLPAPVWPSAGVAEVSRAAGKALTAAGSLPIKVAPTAGKAGTVRVELLDRASVPEVWRDGLVARLSAKSTAVFDYRAFRYAYGGDWASRLRLWQLPECGLTAPDRPECRATPIRSRNDPATGSVTGEATGLVTLAAGPSGPAGDFGATSLAPSSTWSVGGGSGDFSWKYDVRTPPAIGGAAPQVSLSYSSASADGRNVATNNQPSWLGEGFEYSPGYIERRYVPCDEDKSGSPNNPAQTGDLCWRSDNATLSLNGASTELIWQSGKGWHARTENGADIVKLTGADNGDENGEHWKVTTNDGIVYYFGLAKLPGQSTATASTWTVPVYGNHAGEWCHQDTFTDSDCAQAWRWNLDYVVDTHGNTTSYWYAKEQNQYAAEGTSSKNTSYTRGGSLSRIDYGTWDRIVDGVLQRSVQPQAQVQFEVGDRCLSGCSEHDGDHWPDTPWDQECKADATTCDDYTPTFWSTKRLARIVTKVWDTTRSPAHWQDVDSYRLNPAFPSPGDGQKAGLWLDSVVRTGHVTDTDGDGTDDTPAVTLPPVTFLPESLPNRVLTRTNTTNNWQRLNKITTETGAIVQVTYSLPDCKSGDLPSSPQSNERRCYPVEGPNPYDPGGPDITEYWHKYVVEKVSQADVQLQDGRQGPTVNTYYQYEDSPAWHYADDDGLTKPSRRTWDQFRGYRIVAVRVGDSNQTLTRTKYLRGMHGDRADATGGRRTETVDATIGDETVYDEDQFAGMVREQVTYNGTEDKPIAKQVNVPWRSTATATRDGISAHFIGTATTYGATALGANGERGWRITAQRSDFDDVYGTVKWAQDDGDIARAGDEQCVTTAYRPNVSRNITILPSRVTTTALPCGTTPTKPEEVINDSATFYDGATTSATAPARGVKTQVDELKEWTAGSGTVWLTTVKSTYDDFGRPESTTDVKGSTSTIAYTPATGLTTQLTETNHLAWASTTSLAPYWGLKTKSVDPNGKFAEAQYDPLGRTARVWELGWARADHPTQPSSRYSYGYAPERNQYPYVKAESLNAGGGVDVTYTIYDGLLRTRQTQTESPGTDRVVTDTQYDAYGRESMTFGPHAEPGGPSSTLWWEPEWSVPTQNVTTYDRAGRATKVDFRSGDGVTNVVTKWSTTTAYAGDRVTVVPPPGGTTTTTVTDAQGRTAELWLYTAPGGEGGAHRTTRYQYDPKDQLTKVIDNGGNEWTYKYDPRGRKIESKDPDSGRTQMEYNVAGEPTKSTDAENKVLAYSYDSLGRKTGVYNGSVSDANKRAEWKYDTLAAPGRPKWRGKLTETIRYDHGNAYKWQVINFSSRYAVAGEQWIIPEAETGLAGTYVYGHGYSAYTGVPTRIEFPSAGGLPPELVTTKVDAASGLPTSLETTATGVGAYVAGQQYSAYGEPTIGMRKITSGVYAEEVVSYEPDTRRVHEVKVRPETASGTVSDKVYKYDGAGNIDRITDTPAVGSSETQCFDYDALRQLTSAWTPRTGVACETAPTVANLGGPAPYWLDWNIDDVGNLTGEVSHAAAGNTTRAFAVPASGASVVRPHAMTGQTETVPGQTPKTTAYTYDATGNTVGRTGPAQSQTMTWDAEGRLASVSEGSAATTHVYDPDGGRLIRRDPTSATLYLPGMELRRQSSTTNATRYYSFAGRTVASRVPGTQTLTWLYEDHQGTQHLSINAYTQKADIRRQTPYGRSRGTQPVWPTFKGFVGGDVDPTGLVHLGAREYDPISARFISVDPLLDLSDPKQWNGYGYSNNNPVTFADPTGLMLDCMVGDKMVSCGTPTYNNTGGTGQPSHAGGSSGGGHPSQGGGGSRRRSNASPPKRPAEVWYFSTKVTAPTWDVYTDAYLAAMRKWKEWGARDPQAQCMATDNTCVGADIYDVTFFAEQLCGQPGIFCPAHVDPGAAGIANSAASGLFAGRDGGGGQRGTTGQGGSKSAAKPSFCSFSGDTEILMADGSTKRIDAIKPGDVVLATDPETGETGPQAVERAWVHDDQLRLLSTAAGDISTTEDHPFWNATERTWERADEFADGDRLATPSGFVNVTQGTGATSRNAAAYNLTIDGPHTYYVLAGTTPVLVHNCGEGGAASSANGDRLRRQLAEEAGQLPGIRSADDIFDTPSALRGGVTPDQVRPFFAGRQGWVEEGLGRGKNAGGGWLIREYTGRGDPTGRMLRWNPGGGHHGEGAYWRVVGPQGDLGGIIR